MATKTAERQAEARALIKTIERQTCFRLSAACDDGSAFLIATDRRNAPMGQPFRLTLAKLRTLAALGPAPSGLRN